MIARMEVFLKHNPALSCLGVEDWLGMMDGTAPVRLERGACLFLAGAAASSLFLVAGGAVALREAEAAGEGLGPLGPGELVGTEALVPGSCYARSALALAPLEAWPIPAARLRACLDGNFDAALAMIATVAASLRLRVKEISELKLQSTPERLAVYLAERALAERLGMDPATLSRAFAKLRHIGVTTDRGDRVAIADLGRLRAYAGVEPPPLDDIA